MPQARNEAERAARPFSYREVCLVDGLRVCRLVNTSDAYFAKSSFRTPAPVRLGPFCQYAQGRDHSVALAWGSVSRSASLSAGASLEIAPALPRVRVVGRGIRTANASVESLFTLSAAGRYGASPAVASP